MIEHEGNTQVNTQAFNRISEHIYLLDPEASTDRPVLAAIVGSRATLVFDAGNSPRHANLLLNELAKGELLAPKYVVLSHWHWDHVFGSSAYKAPIFAHEETTQKINELSKLDWSDEALDRRVESGEEIGFCRDMIKAEWPTRHNLHVRPPDISFKTHLEFELGGVMCQVEHVGGDHASDSCVLFIPEDRTLFLGDALYEDLHHGPPNYTIKKLYPLINNIMRYEADYYIWSHDTEPMPYKDMKKFTELLKKTGNLLQQTGANRDMLLQKLKVSLGHELNAEHLDIVDAFLSGL